MLYAISVPTSRFPEFKISRISPADASSTELDAYEITDMASLVPGSFGDPVVEGTTAFWVSGSASAAGTDLQIWKYEFRDRIPDMRVVAEFSTDMALSSFLEFDTDDGTFLVHARDANNDSLLVLYDLRSGDASVHGVGLNIIDADLLKLG